ncbi:MAG: HD domain-containing protein [Tissierellia bacterium]|nr:HD domain-containing protein [Tissierellia bacterium]
MIDNRYSLIDRAILFAVSAHAGAKRKGSNLPYILHPLDVGKITSTMTDDEEVIAAAILHDTVEDVLEVDLDTIRRGFGDRVAELVASESEDKRPDEDPSHTWEIRKQETLNALGGSSLDVKRIALADKLSNLRDMYMDQLELGDALWQRFNQKDKKMHAWYYGGIQEKTMELKDTTAWKAYGRYYKMVFGEDHDD